jgi:hypothetical protein
VARGKKPVSENAVSQFLAPKMVVLSLTVNRGTPKSSFRVTLILVLTAMILGGSASAQIRPKAQSLDGLWLTDGYRELIEIQGNHLRIYEITDVSCISAIDEIRTPGGESANEIVFSGNGDTVRIFPANSVDTRWLHDDGSIANVFLHRTRKRPQSCRQTLADTPITNYQIFWETYAEQYPFFALHKIDWRAVDERFRPQVTPDTKPEKLFQILSGMIEPLHDAHTKLTAPALRLRFEGYRPAADRMQKKNVARINEIINKYVSGGLRGYCNTQIQFGLLHSIPQASTKPIGYLRINSFEGYSNTDDFVPQLDALEVALDDIFGDSDKFAGLVIDVRINPGGFDPFGVVIASRLAKQEYLAYSKVIRNDIHDPTHRTEPQRIMVPVSSRPSFHGPVVLLTSVDSDSGAETFAMALFGREPHVTRVGTSTQGVFSDILVRHLPNGWRFGLPNEIYLTEDGKSFDARGVPPDIEVPVFSAEDLANGGDSALDKALEILSPKTK